jgi:hypothetical protein
MRLLTIISVLTVVAVVSGCARLEDDGYLSPPATAFDQVAATERAHVALRSVTYLDVTNDRDCREACDVFERGFDHARTVRIAKPSQCVNEYEVGLWSQTEYQEGCRAYALSVLALIDRYRQKNREGVML